MKNSLITREIYDNRELSWLKFNLRVLEEAFDEDLPLLEQLKFEAIFSQNLDEFFMVRVGSLVNRALCDDGRRDSKTKLKPSEQLQLICTRVRELTEIKDGAVERTEAELEKAGVRRFTGSKLSGEKLLFAKKYFAENIKPALEARLVCGEEGTPFFAGGETYTAVLCDDGRECRYGFIAKKSGCEKILILPSENGSFEYIATDDLILHFAEQLFLHDNVIEKTNIRITRSADIDIDREYERTGEPLAAAANAVERRKTLPAVRLTLSAAVSERFENMLAAPLQLPAERIFVERTPADMSCAFLLYEKLSERSELYAEPLTPRRSPSVSDDLPVYKQIEKGDILLSYPYESIEPFLWLLEQSAEDEEVLSIKMTLYRTAKHSRVTAALCKAAQNGKEVTVGVELRARFDEEHNIATAKKLAAAGCRVVFGKPYYKVHSKLCLITRRTPEGISRITQIGTGNYNEKTARLYADLSLMTANENIAADAEEFFAALCEGRFVERSRELLVAPLCLRERLMEMMEREIEIVRAGGEGYIGAKMNSLTDKRLIDKLIECSCAGVRIDLIVRGSCCLVAGVKGATENIRVISIVGRNLEHARIYIFGSEQRRRVYISSADLMTRNTIRRVEVAAPIIDREIKKRILDYFFLQLSDNVKARTQQSDGVYRLEGCKEGAAQIDSQDRLFRLSYEHEPKIQVPLEKPAEKKKKQGFFARLMSIFKRKKEAKNG